MCLGSQTTRNCSKKCLHNKMIKKIKHVNNNILYKLTIYKMKVNIKKKQN